jgi:hypothetical protein
MTKTDHKRKRSARKCGSASGEGVRERRNQATLEVRSGVISDEGICGLLEDWLIPMIVEELIRARMNGTGRSDPPGLTPPDIS